jgi:hypothetical protein
MEKFRDTARPSSVICIRLKLHHVNGKNLERQACVRLTIVGSRPAPPPPPPPSRHLRRTRSTDTPGAAYPRSCALPDATAWLLARCSGAFLFSAPLPWARSYSAALRRLNPHHQRSKNSDTMRFLMLRSSCRYSRPRERAIRGTVPALTIGIEPAGAAVAEALTHGLVDTRLSAIRTT